MNESVGHSSFRCHCCGNVHHEIPLGFAADFPDPYANLSRDDRDNRALISSDQCIIDQELFFLRGCLELPIIGSEDVFLWGVWARVHEKDFDTIHQFWEKVGRERLIGPFSGRLMNSLSIYPETFNLRLRIEIQPAGQRLLFVLEEPEHVLTLEQQHGLTRDKANEYACILLRKSQTEI